MRDDQIVSQCRVVAHLANALATVASDIADILETGSAPVIEDAWGPRSARLMALLGDILNGMDAVSEEDEWTDPVFAEAARRFPAPDSLPTPATDLQGTEGPGFEDGDAGDEGRASK